MGTYRLVARGTDLQRVGARVYRADEAQDDKTKIVLTDITASFRFSNQEHTHYLINFGRIEYSFGPSGGPPLPGTYWILCSTTPPGPGIWPKGATPVDLSTDDPSTSSAAQGTMRVSGNAKRVYRATDIFLWIPNLVLNGYGAPTGIWGYALPAPIPMDWDIDF